MRTAPRTKRRSERESERVGSPASCRSPTIQPELRAVLFTGYLPLAGTMLFLSAFAAASVRKANGQSSADPSQNRCATFAIVGLQEATQTTFSQLSAAFGRDDLDAYARYKHGAEVHWLRALRAPAMDYWRADPLHADVLVLDLPLGFIWTRLSVPRDVRGQRTSKFTKRELNSTFQQALRLLAEQPRSDRLFWLGTDFKIRQHKLKVRGRLTAGVKLLIPDPKVGRINADPNVGQASSIIVPMVRSGSDKALSWRAFAERPIRTFFIGRADNGTGASMGTTLADAQRIKAANFRDRVAVLNFMSAAAAQDPGHIDIFATIGTTGLADCRPGCWRAPPGCVACKSTRELTEQYRELITKSRYAWHLRGDTPSSNRLYDILAAGAVPIDASGGGGGMRASFPLADIVPWDSIISVSPNSTALTADPGGVGRAWLSTLAPQSAVAPAAFEAILERRGDVLWDQAPARVACNVLITAAQRIATCASNSPHRNSPVCSMHKKRNQTASRNLAAGVAAKRP